MSKHNDAAWYADTFKAWPTKVAGAKPTADMLKAAHVFGKPGKQSLALAMAMRDGGVTAPQIEAVCERPQNNHRKRVIKLGYFTRVPTPADGTYTVYKISLTDKGKARLASGDGMTKAPAEKPVKPAKAKPVKKARKPKAVKVEAAPVEPVNEPVAQVDAPVAPAE